MTVKDLRAEVQRCGARRRGRKFPRDLRAQLQGVARDLRRSGQSAEQIAERLGIGESTVQRWCSAMEPATVTPLVAVEVCEPSAPEGVVLLISPGGWRIEGLDLESAAWLLQRLG